MANAFVLKQNSCFMCMCLSDFCVDQKEPTLFIVIHQNIGKFNLTIKLKTASVQLRNHVQYIHHGAQSAAKQIQFQVLCSINTRLEIFLHSVPLHFILGRYLKMEASLPVFRDDFEIVSYRGVKSKNMNYFILKCRGFSIF